MNQAYQKVSHKREDFLLAHLQTINTPVPIRHHLVCTGFGVLVLQLKPAVAEAHAAESKRSRGEAVDGVGRKKRAATRDRQPSGHQGRRGAPRSIRVFTRVVIRFFFSKLVTQHQISNGFLSKIAAFNLYARNGWLVCFYIVFLLHVSSTTGYFVSGIFIDT